jgi:hypothetical protein
MLGILRILAAAAALAFSAAAANATPIVWDFNSTSQKIAGSVAGLNETWQAGAFTIETFAGKSGTLVDQRTGGIRADDEGLGICTRDGSNTGKCKGTSGTGADAEISGQEVLGINLNSLAGGSAGPNHPGWTLATMTLSSVDKTEKYDLFGCTKLSACSNLDPLVAGGTYTEIVAGGAGPANNSGVLTLNFTKSQSNTFEYLFIVADGSGSSVLLSELTGFTVPEPMTVTLFGAGLLGMGFLRRRKSA